MPYDNNPQGQAEYDSIVNALAAATSDMELAKRDYQDARMRNDLVGETDATERIADARHRVNTLAGGKQAMDERYAEATRPPQQQGQQQGQWTAGQYIDYWQRSGADMLRQHPEYVSDSQKMAQLQRAHAEAVAEASAEGLDENSTFYRGAPRR
jgi:hypothetical protein